MIKNQMPLLIGTGLLLGVFDVALASSMLQAGEIGGATFALLLGALIFTLAWVRLEKYAGWFPQKAKRKKERGR